MINENVKHPLQIALEDIGLNCGVEFKIRSYSGRGMYGKECLAIDGDDINLMQLGFIMGQQVAEERQYLHTKVFVDESDMSGMRSDSMGLGMVYYWPHIAYVGNMDEDDEEIYDDE